MSPMSRFEAASAQPQQQSLRRRLIQQSRLQQQDEDATELRLGPEYQTEHCLLYSEVKILMEKLRESAEAQNQHFAAAPLPQSVSLLGTDVKRQLGPSFQKTLSYTSQLSQFNSPETIKEVRKVLMATKLEPFETAQLANLLPEKADEAKTLIPSIGRLDDDELEPVLAELQNLRRFQG